MEKKKIDNFNIVFWPREMVIFLIKIYQKFLSPDYGIFKAYFPFGYCRFTPSCSQYAIKTLEKHGLFIGGIKAAWRIVRCNPFNKGGWDPVK